MGKMPEAQNFLIPPRISCGYQWVVSILFDTSYLTVENTVSYNILRLLCIPSNACGQNQIVIIRYGK